jgi:hypothetical protein
MDYKGEESYASKSRASLYPVGHFTIRCFRSEKYINRSVIIYNKIPAIPEYRGLFLIGTNH